VARIRELSASIHSAEGELVGLLAELDDHEGWCGNGFRSLEHWLSVNAGFTLGEARQRAALADRHHELTHLMGALDRGALSVGAARAAASVATAANDEAVTEVATTTTAQQAARVFATLRRIETAEQTSTPPPEDPSGEAMGPDQPPHRHGPSTWCSTWWNDTGHLELKARLDSTAGALLRCALQAARAHLARSQPGTQITNIDALIHMAELTIDIANSAGLRNTQQERFAVHVTIDAEVLTGQLQGAGTLDDNTPVSSDTVRNWLNNATIDGTIIHRGRPIHLGRTRRTANTALRRALQLRDRGCAFPGCDRTDHLHAHHIQPWSHGGTTDIDQMVLLCSRHHRLHHQGDFNITTSDAQPRFNKTNGAPITPSDHPPPQTPPTTNPTTDQTTDPTMPPKLAPLEAGTLPCPPRTGEPLTAYALDVLVHHLFTAG
jgi:hypothetical protein